MNKDTAEIIKAVQNSMELLKCRKCGCMKKSLESMRSALSATENIDFSVLMTEIQTALDKTEPSEYT
nr:hypothetical protein [Sedimentibacter sp.]